MVARPRTLLLLALGCGLLTAVLTGLFLSHVGRKAGSGQRPVVVVTRTVAANTLLTEELLALDEWPAAAPLPGAVSTVAEVAGRRTLAPLVAGQPVLAHQLQDPGGSTPDGMALPGMRLITIPIDPELSFGYRLEPGDRVDVLRVRRSEGRVEATLALQGLLVYAVGEAGPPGRLERPQTVTLLVTPGEALELAELQAAREVRLLLRPAGGESVNGYPNGGPALTPGADGDWG